MKSIFLLFIFNAAFLALYGQKFDLSSAYQSVNSNHYFRINYQNDIFVSTDRNYTQGTSYEFVSPLLEKNPMNFLFVKPLNSTFKYGIALEHLGFTPQKIESTEIQYGDRPFASTVMIRCFLNATNRNKSQRFSSSLSLGVIGPLALGEETQTMIHRAIGDRIPLGWKNQISNHIVVNYKMAYEKQVFRYRELFSISLNGNAQAGTLFSNASVGSSFMLGKINTLFSKLDGNQDFQLYIFGHPSINFIGYDATMQGGLFGDKSVYRIATADLERITTKVHYGFVFQYRSWFFQYSTTYLSKEFSSGEVSGWGGIYLGYSF